jgi:small subunit ribosomal protein S1
MNHPKPPQPGLEDQAVPLETSTFGEILSQFEESRRRDRGGSEARQGRVVAVNAESVFVDIGLKMEGVLPASDFVDAAGNPGVQPGDKIIVTIKGRDGGGYYELSKVRVERPKDWSSLEKAFAEKKTIGGVVSGVVKGGLTVDVGVRAFLPASKSGIRDQADMEKLVGQEVQCRIIKLDVSEEDVVVDRRVVLEEEEARARQKVFDEIQEGAEVEGAVRSLTQFGAFVDLGGVDGLLHVTDMSWGRVNKPSDLLAEGEQVRVKVLKIDRENRRISLGLKQLSLDPWTAAGEKYSQGQRVRGVVSRVVEFGAFVELEPGVEGLIHLSELSWSKKARKPSDVVKAGEAVEVVVLGVNTADKRIALGLKQALGDPWQDIETRYPAGTVVEGPIVSLAAFGAFIELGEGIEGMIHIGDISRDKRLKHPKDVLNTGQKVRAVVLEIDKAKRRLRLGMKQLEPTTADEYIAEHKSGDTVSGRVVDVHSGKARVEVGDGVHATCRIPAEPEKPAEDAEAGSGKVDLTTLTAMLSAKWKQGKAPNASVRREAVRAGQIRSFRIVALDAQNKQIELELAG